MTHIIDIQWLNRTSLPPCTPVVVSEGVKKMITAYFKKSYPGIYNDGRVNLCFDRTYQDSKLFYIIMNYTTGNNEHIDYIFKFTLYE
jgi:hypothetical protein